MPIFDKVNGVYRKVSKSYSKVNGVWRKDKKIYDRVNGVWREAFSGAIEWTNTKPSIVPSDNKHTIDIYFSYDNGVKTGVRFDFTEPLVFPAGSTIRTIRYVFTWSDKNDYFGSGTYYYDGHNYLYFSPWSYDNNDDTYTFNEEKIIPSISTDIHASSKTDARFRIDIIITIIGFGTFKLLSSGTSDNQSF